MDGSVKMRKLKKVDLQIAGLQKSDSVNGRECEKAGL